MKASSLSEIKQELVNRPPKELLELCLRLARYKKENKELLTYLLFEADDEESFIINVKKEIETEFNELPKSNDYFTRKSLRKILRSITKYTRHTGNKQAEAEWLIFFCNQVILQKIALNKSVALSNLYAQQLKKITKLVMTFHEDLQYDFIKELDRLQTFNTAPEKTRRITSLFKKKSH